MKAQNVIQEAHKNLKRRWKFIEGKERPIVYIGLILAFLISVSFIYVIYDGITEKYLLQMKFDSE